MAKFNYASAAHRLWLDAEVLFKGSRLGTPDHLYGLVAECVLKAFLCHQGVIKDAKHLDRPAAPFDQHAPRIWDEYCARAHGRNILAINKNNPFKKDPRGNKSQWDIGDRYLPESFFTPDRVNAHRQAAQQVYQQLESLNTAGVIQW